MKSLQILGICTLSFFFACNAEAQLFRDGNLLTDETNQREWITLNVTNGLSHNEVQFETQPGGDFEGYQIATSGDFVQLAAVFADQVAPFGPSYANIPLHSPDYPVHGLGNNNIAQNNVDDFVQLIGGTNGIFTSELAAAGQKDAFEIDDEVPAFYITESIASNIASGDYGVMLYRDFCDPCPPLLGDVNLDGLVNLLDVQPFVAIIAAGEFQNEADINLDGFVNLLDVQPFVDILTGN